jgi:methyl-accepting chemotaxis protein
MLNNLTIGRKLAVLTTSATIILLLSAAGMFALDRTLSSEIDTAVTTGEKSAALIADARSAHVNFQRQVQEWKNVLIRGNNPELYEKHFKAFQERADDVQKGLDATEQKLRDSGMQGELAAELKRNHAEMLQKYLTALESFDRNDPETGKKVDELVRGVDRATSSNFDKLIDSVVAGTNQALTSSKRSSERSILLARIGSVIMAVLGLVVFFGAFKIIRRVRTGIESLHEVVRRLNKGDFSARASATIGSNDELDNLGFALNNLLEDRIATFAKASRENDQLNESITHIMMGVADLSKRNLKVKLPVSEDVTGAVSDAINMMTASTARALGRVRSISSQVSQSSKRARERANAVGLLANESGKQANAASSELGEAATALRQIGGQARDAGQHAERALAATAEAMSVVRATVESIGSSRRQVEETEARMKSLSDISNKISTAVTLIEEIAERTSVIALTASMQAVAAGEAGRGFAVVADEVKRLAENAHGATKTIADLVKTVKTEANETANALSSTVAYANKISHLAERAGSQMDETRAATQVLAQSVQTISQAAQAQAESSERLLNRAEQLIKSSQRTLQEIELQQGDTEELAESAVSLVETISEFQLPS